MKPSLLERLNQKSASISRTHDAHKQALIVLWQSIERHLQQLLNTRHGACASQPSLGLPLVSPLSLQGDNPQARQLCQVIQGQIERFEPRLTQAKIEIVNPINDTNAQQIRYRLSAYALTAQETWLLSYRINIDGDGIFKVSLEASQSTGQRSSNDTGLMVKL
ncbi:type VI secretion system lysozyme-like protein [Oceanospirillum multiglobuliferum]|uniref:IraD/Gp25-like domain-containing protein n=1 Tax=Oceanospirillum multiglobuliferum TaxID=64969 RepID=A0A1T4MT10_9GAMM|nr:type VI secretion system baseplate subunit TssE [Oceanospirillum multiglobuliferum]OPX56897.1 hypothetical protein BTE48_00220 [Oceanospirillum multiglobuliferum]SJZ70209.1 type VI secretion system lysozyme-like protein [Oceanospirillum multiglobuliferum]